MSAYGNALEMARRTPDTRNRYVDFLRAFSILVVVVGHWLMAAPQVVGDGVAFNHLLSTTSWTHYLTWILQVMPLFFLVGGYANAASWRSARLRGEPYGAWLRARLRRLVLPVLPLLAVWAVVAYALFQSGLDPGLIRIGSQAALVPLWFLATYLAVVALTPVTLRAWDRFGFNSLIVTAALAGLMDLISLGFGFAAAGYLNYLFVWGTVHGVGYAWADSRLGGVTHRLILSAGGLFTTAALVVLGPYPVAMVGLDTEAVTNSQPPKVTLIALALFQTGLFLAVEGPVRRWLARDRVWAPVVMVNGRIMTIYLWHMTAMVLMIGGLMLAGGLGLGIDVDSSIWWLTRPLWLAALAVVTLPFIAGFGRFERPREDRRPAPSVWRPIVAVVL
ncbi:MAG TPA: acyltransferase, partial [Acidimicrobiia bacterium]|nr:acyltransferase [Acidimicrobiia bacterium]